MGLVKLAIGPNVAKAKSNHWRVRIARSLANLDGCNATQEAKQITQVEDLFTQNRCVAGGEWRIDRTDVGVVARPGHAYALSIGRGPLKRAVVVSQVCRELYGDELLLNGRCSFKFAAKAIVDQSCDGGLTGADGPVEERD